MQLPIPDPNANANANATSPIRIVTFNLRYDSKPDDITVEDSLARLPDPLQPPHFLAVNGSEVPWSTRRMRVAHHILSSGVTLFCVQEALFRQVDDLQRLFGEDWAHIGVGRDDGREGGEYSAIYYKKAAVDLQTWDSFWLSHEPFKPSRLPGAGSYRVCTAARFTLKSADGPKNFSLLNTHLDDRSDVQRRLAGSMLLYRAKYEAATTGNPVFVAGDFNSPPTGSDSGAYRIATGQASPVTMAADFTEKFAVPKGTLPNFKLLDLRGETLAVNVGANYATFTGFYPPNNASAWSRIDFVFAGSNLGWKSRSYKVDNVLSDDGVLASDHRPVFVDVDI